MSIQIGPNKPQWIATGNNVRKGDLVTITATGTMKYQNRGRDLGPEGEGSLPPDNNYVRKDLPMHALIGTISQNSPPIPMKKEASQVPFLVGNEARHVAEIDGELYLTVNDNISFFQDNTGSFDVTIEVKRNCSTSGDKTRITFKNEAGEAVEWFWVNYQCEEQSYGTIAANQSRSINTFTTHPWRVRSKETQKLLPLETSDGNRVYTYTNTSTSQVTVTVRE